MVALHELRRSWHRRNILVAGDLILDSYTIGKAKRISPEAPVAVVLVNSEEQRPGGAGNAILNLISLGASVTALGRIGADYAGQQLAESLEREGALVNALVTQTGYPTPVKNRIVASGQQLVRVDHEKVLPLDKDSEQQLINRLPQLLEGIDAIAISDYGKGFLTPTLLRAIISEGRRRQIPVISDPKGEDFSRYNGSTILKPNAGETYAAAAIDASQTMEEAALRLHSKVDVDLLMVTRSEQGISLYFPEGKQEHYPVKVHEVRDVTGAGDTVLATVVMAIANGFTAGSAAHLANIAASIAIEQFGCARVSFEQIATRLTEAQILAKIHYVDSVDEEDKDGMVAVPFSAGSDPAMVLLQTLQRLQQLHQEELVLHVSDQAPGSELLKLLAAHERVRKVVVSP